MVVVLCRLKFISHADEGTAGWEAVEKRFDELASSRMMRPAIFKDFLQGVKSMVFVAQ